MDLKNKIIQYLKEATSESGSRGSYSLPLQPGLKKFDKNQLSPFSIQVSKYDNAELNYDSLDGNMDEPKKKIKKMEKKSNKISNYKKNHPTINDDDGDIINPTPGKLNEWIEITESTVLEDLGVWFGTKKKPKGSKQPKGPWVNICRKKEGGGHPPCGRPDADSKGYPKCRAAGVASKMTDAQKRSACQQKRKAEKSNPKSGTGNSPTMVSYKPKKQNEQIKLTESQIKRLINTVLNNGL
jgi:hypothetical protein